MKKMEEKKKMDDRLTARDMYQMVRWMIPKRMEQKMAFIKSHLASIYPSLMEREMSEHFESFLLAILSLSESYDEVHRFDSALEDH